MIQLAEVFPEQEIVVTMSRQLGSALPHCRPNAADGTGRDVSVASIATFQSTASPRKQGGRDHGFGSHQRACVTLVAGLLTFRFSHRDK